MPHCKGWKPQKLKQWECETNKKIVHHHIPHSLSLSPSTRRLHSRSLHPLKCNGWFSFCTACSPDRRGLTSEPGNEILYIYMYIKNRAQLSDSQSDCRSLDIHPPPPSVGEGRSTSPSASASASASGSGSVSDSESDSGSESVRIHAHAISVCACWKFYERIESLCNCVECAWRTLHKATQTVPQNADEHTVQLPCVDLQIESYWIITDSWNYD